METLLEIASIIGLPICFDIYTIYIYITILKIGVIVVIDSTIPNNTEYLIYLSIIFD